MKDKNFNNNSQNTELLDLLTANKDLEKEIIGMLVQHPQLMDEAYGRVKVEDFTGQTAAMIFDKMSEMYEKKETWDIMILNFAFQNDLDVVLDYLLYLPSSYGEKRFLYLLDLLKKDSVRKQIIRFESTQLEKIKDIEPSEISRDALTFFSGVESTLKRKTDWKIEELIKSHRELMKLRYEDKARGIPTGFNDLDFALGQGMQRKDLIIIGARPSVGKTSFSLTVAYNAAQAGAKVLFLTLEMDDQEVFDRLVAFDSKLALSSIIRGTMKTKADQIERTYENLQKLSLSVMHVSKATSGDVYSIASKYKITQGLDLLVVDYLGYLADEGDDEVLRLGRISKSLKTTANLLDCAVLAPHQLSRRIEYRGKEKKDQPMLSDLRDSGHIEQDADVIMFLNRDILGNKGEQTTLRIGKNRTGETSRIDLRFNVLTTKFES